MRRCAERRPRSARRCASSGRGTRPCGSKRTAWSTVCWIRGTFDANEAMTMRPFACEKIDVNASPTIRSESVWPGRSAFVESESMQSTPSSPTARDAGEVGRLAVDRRLIELEVAGVKDRAHRRAQRQRAGTRDRVVDVDELGLDLAVAHAVARLDRRELGFAELLLARLRLDQRDRQRRRDDRRVAETPSRSTGMPPM